MGRFRGPTTDIALWITDGLSGGMSSFGGGGGGGGGGPMVVAGFWSNIFS